MTIHEKIRFYREKAGLTQDECAKALGVAQSTYQHIETKAGEPGTRELTIRKLVHIARVLGVHPCFINRDVCEVSTHVRYGDRSRALAARFERTPDQRWRCTALEFA